MTISRVKVWASEVLTATDLNAEFNNVLNFLNASPIIAVDSLSKATGDILQWTGSAWANITGPTPTAWTPTVGGTATYTTRTASYIKIGKMVTFYVEMTINAIGSGAPSSITGLPFTSASGIQPVSVGFFTGGAISVTSLMAYIAGGSTSITFCALTAAAASVTDNATFMQNGTRVTVSGTYEATT